jgi:shikimate 5-dehydrogenase
MLVGLLGANIQGSMSPALFAAAFAAASIDFPGKATCR